MLYGEEMRYGIYVTGSFAGKGKIFNILDELKEANITMLVIDLKTISGELTFKFDNSLANDIRSNSYPPIKDISFLIDTLKKEGFYLIGRTTVCYDDILSSTRPDLALYIEKNYNFELIPWVNPSCDEVVDYNLNVIEEAYKLGFDEVQLDYIRYPATKSKLVDFKGDFIEPEKRKFYISSFCKQASIIAKKYNRKISIDVFGVTAWGRIADINQIGQHIGLISHDIKIISPMLYPSHFYNFYINGKPAENEPELIIEVGCNKIRAISEHKDILVRPWLQAFTYRVPDYGPDYIIKQIFGALNANVSEVLFWNPVCSYKTVYKALQILKSFNIKNDNSLYILEPVSTEATTNG